MTSYISKFAYTPLFICSAFFAIVWVFWSFNWLLFLLLILLVLLYRNPQRVIECQDSKAILSPVDGKITSIQNITHQDLGECIELNIKNSLYESGVLRSCTKMQIENIKIRHGFFGLNLYNMGNMNEKLFILAKSNKKKFALRICAGSLDREIKFNHKKRSFEAAEEIGFSLNSDIALLLPKDSRIQIGLNDEVKSASLIGYFS